MALDSLDIAVLVALVIGTLAFFTKGKLWGVEDNQGGFLKNAEATTSTDLISVLKKNNKNTVVFYGSQTGTAEDYASKLSKELSSKFGLSVMNVDFADYEYENFADITDDILCFFIVATYGEGEPTDNAIDFVEWMDNEADTLSSLRYAVFGLGNSTYEFYNAIGKKFDTKLEELGAERFAPYGEGDDGQGTMDEDFLSWKDSVFDSLKSNLDFEERESVYEPSLKLIERLDLSIDSPNVSLGEPDKLYLSHTSDLSKGPFDHTHPYLSKIVKSKELFNSKDRFCVHAEFDLSNTNLRYTTGDHLAIWPSNCNENIESFLTAFGLGDKLDDIFELKALDSTVSIPFHTPITYGAVVRHHLEISGDVSRQFISSIANFAPSEDAKKETLRLGNDKVAFAEEIHHKRYNIADALLHISKGEPWKDVPFEFIIESISHLQPRYYSISSSSLSEKTSIHITAVVEGEDLGDHIITGVVTNLLKDIEIVQNGSKDKPLVHYDLSGPRDLYNKFKLPVHVRRSTFKLPSSPSVPIILIGPGTGVAPFRGFVRERIVQKNNGSEVGETILFYGCRTEEEDFLYKEEWPEYAKELGVSFQMYTAFSRQDPSKKVYVQDKVSANASKISKLLEEGAFIYVCGDASKMARDVQNAITKILSTERNITFERAAELIRSYKVQNKYQEDIW
ncbi:uncharacterized protein PRCAT00000514001 [Priceomyces carsonii]|uniref:uncharacterized protein n=1 Tax=Priceomyces carsonii TaxID=28549 RepID=UPI002EDA2DE2|nr:unnamed protein product [Priceomyces carsonii]